MKNSLILPLVYVFILLLVLILLTSVSFLYDISLKSVYRAKAVQTTIYSINRIPEMALDVFPASCLLSLVFLFLRICKKPGLRLFTFLLSAGAAAAALIFGFWGLKDFVKKSEFKHTAQYYIRPGVFNPHSEFTLYATSMDDNSVRNIIKISHSVLNEGARNITYSANGSVRINDSTVSIHNPAGGDPIQIGKEPVYSPLFSINKMTEGFLYDLAFLNAELNFFFKQNRLEFIQLCAGFVFFITAAGAVMRLTKWPLFNFLVFFALSKGIIYLYKFLRYDFLNELLSSASPDPFIRQIPVLILFGLGTLILLIDFIFIPYRFWEQEKESD